MYFISLKKKSVHYTYFFQLHLSVLSVIALKAILRYIKYDLCLLAIYYVVTFLVTNLKITLETQKKPMGFFLFKIYINGECSASERSCEMKRLPELSHLLYGDIRACR